MDKVRVGIIGFGGMGSHHGRYLAQGQVPGAVITAACDTNPDRLRVAKEQCGEGIQLFESAEALFAAEVVDAVMIATPHYFHPPLAIQAFKNDCHVLSEKPAGVYTKQVREMNEAAAASGKVFGLMFNQRTVGAHQKMKELVESGEIGEIKRTQYCITDWFRSQAYYDSGGWRATWGGEGGGVLINQCPHNLDLWQWICGLPKRVRASMGFGRYHSIEVEDDVTAIVEYENGATGVFIATTGEAPGTNFLEIAGDRGKLLLQGGNITFWRTRVPVSQFMFETKKGFEAPECWKCEIPGGGGGAHEVVTRAWVQAILKGSPLIARGEEGIHGLQLSNAMHLSAWTGGNWVDLPVDEDLYLEKLQEQVKNSKIQKGADGKALDFTGTF